MTSILNFQEPLPPGSRTNHL